MKTNPKTLTKAEEEIMQALWQLDKAFVKDIVDLLPAPKPHYNTVSTIIKILCDKGFVGYESFGKSNRYYPLVQKDEYSKKTMNQFVSKYFNGSFAGMLSFFAQEKDITVQDLEAILKELKQSPDKK
ncbi:MAG: BlaI/MecI/CopY family transcriptional regulator [Flavipsychrobacter sp.]|jgi:BlaI family transcriptional regulator, penicillinase repressor|nr:BlaI/MecI/CopY family transcriptional regulator [Chitinophagales bacterium]